MNERNYPPVVAAPNLNQAPDEQEVSLVEYWDMLVDNVWIIAGVCLLAIVVGLCYAVMARPVYETDALIQVEDSAPSAKGFLGDASNIFDVKTPAAGEVEIIRSRMIVSQAVDNLRLYVDSKPKYIPVIGQWLASRATKLSEPGFLGLSGYVRGTESIVVSQFNVPESLETLPFKLIVTGENSFSLFHPENSRKTDGFVGQLISSDGISLLVTALAGKKGAEFSLIRYSRLNTIDELQEKLDLAEKGRQSGVIQARLRGSDPKKIAATLNEIGRQYVRQNIERKAAEAEKTLKFLDVQLPQFRIQMNKAEEAYTKYRNKEGTIALDEEAKLVLAQVVDYQTKLVDAQQRRRELEGRFTSEHPLVQTLDAQIASIRNEISGLNVRVKKLPNIQQDALRLERDVRVNNELYQQLQNNSLQLNLVKEGKIGNVRLIDEAVVPEIPVWPRKIIVLLASFFAGLLAGVIVAILRSRFFVGIRSPQEVELATGLGVFATVPLSVNQAKLAQNVAGKSPVGLPLALITPNDPAIESLRSLRTALQFAMLEARNNRIVVTGATPGVGKSFISTNLAAVMAIAGKKVLLIDADLRKGYIHQHFGKGRDRGLSEMIVGAVEFDEATHFNVVDCLDLITTGAIPPNPAELLMSDAFGKLLDKIASNYDIVIIDTPPVLVAADTGAVVSHAGTVLMVARANLTQIGEIRESEKRLRNSGGIISGVVFNAMDMTRRYYGSAGYKYANYNYKYTTYKYDQ